MFRQSGRAEARQVQGHDGHSDLWESYRREGRISAPDEHTGGTAPESVLTVPMGRCMLGGVFCGRPPMADYGTVRKSAPVIPIQAPILHGLGDMLARDRLGAAQVGDGAGQL